MALDCDILIAMDTEVPNKSYNKLALVAFSWLCIVILGVVVSIIFQRTNGCNAGTSIQSIRTSYENIIRLLVISLVIPSVLGIISFFQIRRTHQRGRRLAIWASWGVGLVFLLYIASSLLFLQCGDI